MSRINTNVQSLIAQRVLGQNNSSLNTSLERLSTGLRINRGKDDPAGLIASENLKKDLTGINAAIANGERADQVINIAEGGLNEVSNLLNELQGLLTASANAAGLSTAEKEANQLQIDSILQTIDSISGQTSFQGTKLLNGNLEYSTSSINAGVTDFRINGAKFTGSSVAVIANVTQSAQTGRVFLSTNGNIAFSGGATSNIFSIEVSGALGSREISFQSGATVNDIANAINQFTDLTGVEATASGTGVRLDSSEFGGQNFVSVQSTGENGLANAGTGTYTYNATDQATVVAGSAATFAATSTNATRDAGQDIGASINGNIATGNGRNLNVNTDFLNVEITLSNTASQTLGSITAFNITGGGADFQLAGNVDIGGRVAIGIEDLSSRKLGNSSLGFLDELGAGRAFNVVTSSANELATAQKIVSKSIEQISQTRGRLGAFQKNVIGSTIRSLGVAAENTAAANSVIADADFASETAALSRSQVLVAATQNTLQLANQNPQQALQLLG
ncbi:MAG: flagellin [Phycisphaerae bacterium]|nr:flagellin [Phycisphaerae bacterium]